MESDGALACVLFVGTFGVNPREADELSVVSSSRMNTAKRKVGLHG